MEFRRARPGRTVARHGILATGLLLALGAAGCTSAARHDAHVRPSTGSALPPGTTDPIPGEPPAPERTITPAHDPSLDADLWGAAARNDAGSVRDLLARGAGIETRGSHGRTPLVAATKNNAVAAARVLIQAGADVNAKDDLQDSAYLYAGAEGLDDILELTLQHGADLRSVNRYGGTALIPASEHAHVRTVDRLLGAGVPVNHVNKPGWTALLEAIVYGDGSTRYRRVVTALLDAGADPAIRDASGNTALDNARRRGQTHIVQILQTHSH